MKITSIIADEWKMDGGVCFGVVPKGIWSKLYPEENNLINLVSRCLLVEDGDRKILIDTGMGRKQKEKYYQFKYLNHNITIQKSLEKAGYALDEITDVIFTHLHDDHVGGASAYNPEGVSEPLFPRAQFWCSQAQWNHTSKASKRESASFIKENLEPIINSNRLNLIKEDGRFSEHLSLKLYYGHTNGLMLPTIEYHGKTIVYCGDLIPLSGNIPTVYVASVDILPVVAMEEKEALLAEAVKKNWYLFLEHDYYAEIITVTETKKGILPDQQLKLEDI